MRITSPVFTHNQEIPARYTCRGEGLNPPLAFHDIPAQALALALSVDDPDAPAGLFTHWLVWNIDPKVGGIGENALPAGAIEGTNSAGKIGWVPPCPPSGEHHYFFRLYALDSPINLGQDNMNNDGNGDLGIESFQYAIGDHVIDQAVLVGIVKEN